MEQASKHKLLISPSSSVSSDTLNCFLPVQQCLECCHCHLTSHLRIWEDDLLHWHLLWPLLWFIFCQGWLRFGHFSLVMVILHSGMWDAGKRWSLTMSPLSCPPGKSSKAYQSSHYPPHTNFWQWGTDSPPLLLFFFLNAFPILCNVTTPFPFYLELKDLELFHTTLFYFIFFQIISH